MFNKKNVLSEAELKKIEASRIKSEYAVDAENLVVHYETERATVKAVNSIDIKLKKGSILGIAGETGAGKTTAMQALMRLIPSPPGAIKSGKILVNGIDMLSLSKRELGGVRGKEISMIFQDPMTSLNPVMTVGEQISESILQHTSKSKADALEDAKAILKTVGIDPQRWHEYPHQFSGGMRQRVVIAIALACNPSVLIADEPTTALDVTIQAQVLHLMRELKEKYDTSLLLITHDLGVIAQMCDEVAIMYAGRIVEKGTVRDIFNHISHPYTQGLFGSLPNINQRVNMLRPITGQMPDPANLPSGCSFSPRCPYAIEECRQKTPPAVRLSDTHTVECCRYNDPAFSLDGGME